MATLYEPNAELEHMLGDEFDEECVDKETGDILEDAAKRRFLDLDMDASEKLEQTALLVKKLCAQAEALEREEKSLRSRRERKAKKAAWLKSYMAEYLANTGKRRFETTRCAMWLKSTEAVEIRDMGAFMMYAREHDEYLTYRTPTPKKMELEQAIKGGSQIPGVAVVERVILQIM